MTLSPTFIGASVHFSSIDLAEIEAPFFILKFTTAFSKQFSSFRRGEV